MEDNTKIKDQAPISLKILDIRAEHMGKKVSVGGRVSKVTTPVPHMIEAAFECGRCKHFTDIPQGEHPDDGHVVPLYCSCSTEKKGLFILRQDESKYIDYQEAYIYNVPTMEHMLKVILTEKLVGQLMPDDMVTVVGTLKGAPHRKGSSLKFMYEVKADTVNVSMRG